MSPAVKDGFTLTHLMRVFRDALCGFVPSTSEFVLQAWGPAIPSGCSIAYHCWVELGGLWATWAALPHLWSHNAAAEALGRAASSPVLPQHVSNAAESRTDELLLHHAWALRGKPCGAGRKMLHLGFAAWVEACPALGPWPCFCLWRGAEASAAMVPAPDPSVTCYLLPQAPRSSGRVPVYGQRLASLLKASVLAGPP